MVVVAGIVFHVRGILHCFFCVCSYFLYMGIESLINGRSHRKMLTTNLSNIVKFGLLAGATEIEMRAKSLFLW